MGNCASSRKSEGATIKASVNGVHGPQWSEINFDRHSGKNEGYQDSRGSIDWVDLVVADLEKDANLSKERIVPPPPFGIR
jgi:hypothetical protein